MVSRTEILLWTDSPAAYLDAVAAAGLAHQVKIEALPRKEKPSADQLAKTEALMAPIVPPGLLPAMPKLRWAQSMTAGVEGWLALPDLPANLTLTCARGTHRESMPENILGALFHVAKPYAAVVDNQKRGQWIHTVAQPLGGKTLGILGLGRIGEAIARRATACGMKIRYHNRKRKEVPYPYDADPVTLAANSDVLMVVTPGGAETNRLVGAKVLDALGPKGYLVNIARGSVVDEPVLLRYLQEKRIAGAGLDVFVDEPRVPSEFFQLENCVLFPHVGSATQETRKAMGDLQIENLRLHFAGKPVKTRVV